MINVVSRTEDQTRALGAALARALTSRSADRAVVLALNGELGAGKTTFVAGFMRELGVTGPVRSPTYTLIEPYDLGTRIIYHLDLYRLVEPRDLAMLALRDLLTPGSILLIEWASRGGRETPTADLALTLHYPTTSVDTSREVEIEPRSSLGKELATALQEFANESSLSS